MTTPAGSFPPDLFGRALPSRSPLPWLELLLRHPPEGLDFEDLPEPFARLDDPGGPGAFFLGRLREGGRPMRPVAIVLRKRGTVPFGPEASANRTDAFTDAWFLQIHADLVRLQTSEGTEFPRLVSFGGEEGPDAFLSTLGPLFFCKRRRLFFPPPCPRCGEPLEEGSEATRPNHGTVPPGLAEGGPYLGCPSCEGEEDGSQIRFYRARPAPEGPPLVGDRWDLVRGLGRRVREDPDGVDPRFPCRGCSFNRGCHPDDGGEGDAARLLVPFTFYGSLLWVREFAPLHYGEACDLFAGRNGDDLQHEWGQRTGFERGEVLSDPPAAVDGGFLCGPPVEDRLPLESLLLKLTLFEELCGAVRRLYEEADRPHLDLRPDAVEVDFVAGGGLTPSLWGGRLHLATLDGAVPVSDGMDMSVQGTRAFLPPERLDPRYAHPSCVGIDQATTFLGNLHLISVGTGEGAALEGRLETACLPPGAWADGDRCQVRFGRELGFSGEIALEGTLGPSDGEGVRVRFSPQPLAPEASDRLRSLALLPRVAVTCSLRRSYGLEFDLYSLGMMFFRALLVNSARGETDVLGRCRRVVEGMDARSGPPSEGFDPAPKGWTSEEPFQPSNVRWVPTPDGASPIPQLLWEEVLGLGLRLATRIPGFSYGFDPADRTAPAVLGLVLADVRSLCKRAREGMLVAEAPVDEDLRSILEDLIDDPAWLDQVLSTGAGGPPTHGLASVPASPPGATTAPGTPPGPTVRERSLGGGAVSFEETVILRPPTPDVPETPPVRAEPRRPAGEETSFEETMILQRPPAPGAPPGSPEAPEEATPGFDETVILSQRPGTPPPASGTKPDSESEKEAFEETLILRPGQRPGDE